MHVCNVYVLTYVTCMTIEGDQFTHVHVSKNVRHIRTCIGHVHVDKPPIDLTMCMKKGQI